VPKRLRDDMGRELYFGPAPKRVVSLVPSETFNLFALGLGDRVVGRTDYCVEPAEQVAGIPTVGGTKDADPAKIAALEPDLILANKEENSRPALESLAQDRFRVFVSFPQTVPDAIAHLARLARLFEVTKEPAVKELMRRGYQLTAAGKPDPRGSAFVPIWMKPLMTFRDQTYAHDVLSWAGLDNSFADRERLYPLKADLGKAQPAKAEDVEGRDTRYPRVTTEERGADVVLLPDEPHECTDADAQLFRDTRIAAAERNAIKFVSGKDLFWSGAWTVGGIERLRSLVEDTL
jgi:ABC-type Fe3+-hydroxamate transport system substrate-binding protein